MVSWRRWLHFPGWHLPTPLSPPGSVTLFPLQKHLSDPINLPTLSGCLYTTLIYPPHYRVSPLLSSTLKLIVDVSETQTLPKPKILNELDKAPLYRLWNECTVLWQAKPILLWCDQWLAADSGDPCSWWYINLSMPTSCLNSFYQWSIIKLPIINNQVINANIMAKS